MPETDPSHRAVVTGLGAVTPIGNDHPTFWANALAGKSGGGPITHFDASDLEVRIAAEVKIDLDPEWVVARYRAQFPDWSPERLFYAATTAGRSWPGQVIEADERAKAGAKATWVYQLDRPSPIDPARGAAHTDDIPYVFGTLDAPGSYSGTDARAQATRDLMMKAFTVSTPP